MIRNYLKIAWRNLLRNKVYSGLNIFGLATGMAVALLIGLWVHYQYSYDRFLPNYSQVYKARIRYVDNGEVRVGPATPMPLAEVLKRDIPGISYVAQTDWMGPHSLVIGDRKLYLNGAMAGSDFLNIFPFPLIRGTAGKVLADPYSIVLTESTAKALFGTENPLEQTVRIDNSHDLKVTGILKDLPPNATFRFHYLVPFSFYVQHNDWVKEARTSWDNNSFQTFVALEPHTSYAQIKPQLENIIRKYNPADYKGYESAVVLHAMKDWHLYAEFKNGIATGGLVQYVRMFGIIGVLVLVIACVNFMNLSTARSEKRAREIGVRKVVGSLRKDLIFQFLVESVLVTFVAFLLALLLVQLALPFFRQLTGTPLQVPYDQTGFWGATLLLVLLTGLLAGGRPAFYLSSFQPIKVLKGTIQVGRLAALPRKVLVVLQFTCSTALIISTLVVYQQIRHAKNRPVGYNANRLVMTDGSSDLSKNFSVLKQELLQSGLVTDVTLSSSPVTDIWSNNDVKDWPGKLPNETLSFATIGVADVDYFRTMGMHLKEGRNFSGNLGADSLNVLLNEAAVQRMRLKEPLNEIITWYGNPEKVRVIGVVKDALMRSPFTPAEPTVFVFAPGWANVVTYRLSPTAGTQEALAKLAPLFSKYNPSVPYRYRFVDEAFAEKFAMETLISKLAALFAALAIFISCLGLFGLAAYMAEQRNKEIGVRKVLGATAAHVWALLSKEFVLLVLIGCVLAAPVAYYFLQNWLQQYSYRITIGGGVFVLAALMAVCITLLTVSMHALKAARTNPVKTLRAE